MKRLLDTNAYVALKRGHSAIAELVRSSSELTLSMIVIGELCSASATATGTTATCGSSRSSSTANASPFCR
jgi:predicted nucleic acid-binding protein